MEWPEIACKRLRKEEEYLLKNYRNKGKVCENSHKIMILDMYTRRGVTTTSMRPPRSELQESNTKKILIDGRMCTFYPLVYVEECSITLTFSKLNVQYITIKAGHFSKRCMKLIYQSIQHTTVANEREIGRATCNTQVRFYAVIKEVARQSKQAHPAPPVASQKQTIIRKEEVHHNCSFSC